jgi:hypothetical protein
MRPRSDHSSLRTRLARSWVGAKPAQGAVDVPTPEPCDVMSVERARLDETLALNSPHQRRAAEVSRIPVLPSAAPPSTASPA